MTTSHPLTPRAQRAFARTEKAVAAAREDFAAAQSALQKALARGVDVEATLSQATDVLSDVPGTPLPKTLGPEEAAVERVYDRLGELLDTCKEYDAIHHELEVDTCLADAATNIHFRPFQLFLIWLAGKVLYSNPPYSHIELCLRMLRRLIAWAPATRATVILPHRPWAPSHFGVEGGLAG